MINKNDMLSNVNNCAILAEKFQLILNTEIYKVFSTSTFFKKYLK